LRRRISRTSCIAADELGALCGIDRVLDRHHDRPLSGSGFSASTGGAQAIDGVKSSIW